MRQHRATSTDCLSSIAGKYGLCWESIWSAPENAELRQIRPNPNVLKEGDIVYVPELEIEGEPAETDRRHRFRKTNQTKLMLKLLRGEEPIFVTSYELVINGIATCGRTDGDGQLEELIPATATRGILKLVDTEDELILEFGGLNPIKEISGIQDRLGNLGFDCLRTNELDEETRTALQLFQEMYELAETGEPDGPTKAKIKEVYGC